MNEQERLVREAQFVYIEYLQTLDKQALIRIIMKHVEEDFERIDNEHDSKASENPGTQ